MTVERCRHCSAEIIWATTENDKRIPLDAELVSEGPRFQVVGDEGELHARYFDWTAKLNGKLVVGHRYHYGSCKRQASLVGTPLCSEHAADQVLARARLIDWRGVAQKRRRKLERIFEVAKASSMATDPVATVGLHTNPLEEIAAIVAEPDGVELGYLRSTIPDEVQDLLEQVEIEAYS